ncbi:hypothetical protein RM530_17750 [Algiphilus sp. W345]|uniref:Uncharacterized protein n=1 Tax=Banduia mediterranea TaxID=3075609 RepID=A0ABU2WMU2_9GAMM|nr:hypothetical protein [Algiphilus sp. W345]MDT0499191.1 hypothetical protein [Algiphilus sp. W345]
MTGRETKKAETRNKLDISCNSTQYHDIREENKTINNNKNSRVCKEVMMSLLSKVKDYKEVFGATFLSATLAFAPNALAQDFTKTSHSPTPQSAPLRAHSELVPDADGVLWFRQGADSDTEYSKAQDLSTEDEGRISIVAVSEPALASKVVERARQLRGWLQAHPDVDKDTALVAADNVPRGFGISYFIDGVRFTTDANPSGVFSSNEAAAELPNVVARYVATMHANQQQNSVALVGGTVPALAAR